MTSDDSLKNEAIEHIEWPFGHAAALGRLAGFLHHFDQFLSGPLADQMAPYPRWEGRRLFVLAPFRISEKTSTNDPPSAPDGMVSFFHRTGERDDVSTRPTEILKGLDQVLGCFA